MIQLEDFSESRLSVAEHGMLSAGAPGSCAVWDMQEVLTGAPEGPGGPLGPMGPWGEETRHYSSGL